MADLDLALASPATARMRDWVEHSPWLDRIRQGIGMRSNLSFAPLGLAASLKSLAPGSSDQGLALMQGHFTFAGQRVTSAPGRIFDCEPPSLAWREALYRLDWLQDLVATDQQLARLTARNLLKAWHSKVLPHLPAPLAARALINLSHAAPFIVEHASADFCSAFAHGIGLLCRKMASRWPKSATSSLDCAVALVTATTAFKISPKVRDLAHARLAKALDLIILPDGGHQSRNGGRLVDLALDLVPLRNSLEAAHRVVPPALNAGLERLLPMLRLLSMGDGGLTGLQGTTPRADRPCRTLGRRHQPRPAADHGASCGLCPPRLPAGCCRCRHRCSPELPEHLGL